MKPVKVEIVRWYKIADLPEIYSSRVEYAAQLKNGDVVRMFVENYRSLDLCIITEGGYEPLDSNDVEMFCQIPENFRA